MGIGSGAAHALCAPVKCDNKREKARDEKSVILLYIIEKAFRELKERKRSFRLVDAFALLRST